MHSMPKMIFFLIVVEALILSVAMDKFEMPSLQTIPHGKYVLEGENV